MAVVATKPEPVDAETIETGVHTKEMVVKGEQPGSWQLPDAKEISLLTAVNCAQLMDEMLAKGILTGVVEGFSKLGLPDKRQKLIEIVNQLVGMSVIQTAEQAAQEPAPVAIEDEAKTEIVQQVDVVESAIKKTGLKHKAQAQAEKAAKEKKKPGPKDKTAHAIPTNVLENVISQSKESDDPIITFAARIEKTKNRGEVEDMLNMMSDQSEFNLFKIGGCLARIQANEDWWREAGYETFKDYIETNMQFRYRKGMYAIEIYKKLLLLNVPWSTYQGIGWAKINMLIKVMTTANAAEWVEKAAHMSLKSLEEVLKSTAPLQAEEVTPKTLFNESVKLHADQRHLWLDGIEKAKEETGSDSKGAAVEAIFQHYMGGGLAFSDWKQALVYFRKHVTATEFAMAVISNVEELCPELLIDVNIGKAPTEESTSEETADAA